MTSVCGNMIRPALEPIVLDISVNVAGSPLRAPIFDQGKRIIGFQCPKEMATWIACFSLPSTLIIDR